MPDGGPGPSRERLRATMSTATDAGRTKPTRSEPNCVEIWPTSHGTTAPPKPALENTHPLLRLASNESAAKDKINGKSGASPKPVTEAASTTASLDIENKNKESPASV